MESDELRCQTNTAEVHRLINAYKLVRHVLPISDITVEVESERATLYTKHYLASLKLGLNLPSSELQPADDLALLAGASYVLLWKLTNNEVYLFKAVTLLEFSLTKSPQSFQMRVILIRLYRLMGNSHTYRRSVHFDSRNPSQVLLL